MSQIYYRARTKFGNVVVCHNTEQDKYYLTGNTIPLSALSFDWIDSEPIDFKEPGEFSDKYKLMIYLIRSGLEDRRTDLIVNTETTADNFMNVPGNSAICDEVAAWIVKYVNYEISGNQMYNAIDLFLKAWRKG